MNRSIRMLFWFASFSISGSAEPAGKGPATPASLVANTVAWQSHWDHKVGLLANVPSKVSFKMYDQSEVWVTGLDWTITFVYQNRQPFPHFVQRLQSSPDEVRQRALAPYAQAPVVTVAVPAYTRHFRKLTTFEVETRRKLLDAFKHEACSSDMLPFYRDSAGQPLAWQWRKDKIMSGQNHRRN